MYCCSLTDKVINLFILNIINKIFIYQVTKLHLLLTNELYRRLCTEIVNILKFNKRLQTIFVLFLLAKIQIKCLNAEL